MKKLKVFIGSSSEAKQRSITARLVQMLSARFDPQPWYSVFSAGLYTMQALESYEVDTAIFVFAKDDSREFRERREAVTRDNVVLEYGLFSAKLGPDRVMVLAEEDVALPSDLFGLTTGRFPTQTRAAQDAALQLFVDDLGETWKDLEPRDVTEWLTDDKGIALKSTLPKWQSDLDKIRDRVRAFVQKGALGDKPFEFDSTSTTIEAYVEALSCVRWRYWTTTYITSGFWTKGNAKIFAANTAMLENLGRPTNARRLFLLPKPARDMESTRRYDLIHLRQRGDDKKVAQLENELRHLKTSVQKLHASGFQVRCVHDVRNDNILLPVQMNFDPTDSEIAIYDDFRVDVFTGGGTGKVSGVTIFSRATRFFEEILRSSDQYFEILWHDAMDVGEFLQRLQTAHDSAKERIDYLSNWLARYEFALPKEDEKLKADELGRVKELLRRKIDSSGPKWGQIGSYLDIGTCTGRYPIELREAVAQHGRIVGIDNDADCVEFAKANVQRLEHENRIAIEAMDFLSPAVDELGKFDLITCMLGTISHFGMDLKTNFDDRLQKAVSKMAELLNQNGVLFIGNWSQFACSEKKMLSIYSSSDRDRLAEWTPRKLRKRLTRAGLRVVESATTRDPRIEVFCCVPATRDERISLGAAGEDPRARAAAVGSDQEQPGPCA